MTKQKRDFYISFAVLAAATTVTVLIVKRKTVKAIRGRCNTTINKECQQIPFIGTPEFCENISEEICEGGTQTA